MVLPVRALLPLASPDELCGGVCNAAAGDDDPIFPPRRTWLAAARANAAP